MIICRGVAQFGITMQQLHNYKLPGLSVTSVQEGKFPQTVPTAPPWHSSYPSNAPYESKVAKLRRKMNRAGPNLVKTLRLCLLPFSVMICSKMAHGLARSSIYEKYFFQFAACAAVPTLL